MDEYIEIRLVKNGRRVRIARRTGNGIVLDERDPIERTIGIAVAPRGEPTRLRMDNIRRTQGWLPGQFDLKMSVEDGAIILRGVTPHALPEGFYKIRLQIEEVNSTGGWANVRLEHNAHVVVDIPLTMDDRAVSVDLSACDQRIQEVLDRSRLDGDAAVSWVTSAQKRPTRQACLLNLLASLRVRPRLSQPLIALVDHVFHAANDRVYARVDKRFHTVLRDLADDDDQPFYAEGPPHAKIHEQLFVYMDETAAVKARFEGLLSFRGESPAGRPSMQVVVALAPADLPYTYAEFDLDLGNPLQDIAGFFIHMGELLDGKSTNHLDLWRKLRDTPAGPFLNYRVTAN